MRSMGHGDLIQSMIIHGKLSRRRRRVRRERRERGGAGGGGRQAAGGIWRGRMGEEHRRLQGGARGAMALPKGLTKMVKMAQFAEFAL